ncbi:acyl-CoA thioesterase [Xanthomarina sp. F1114]|uniref:acyl-CoA thioesterase n=1 Tax=Xanthomarina sp. F1114 TaxID=2996019 RepID=UPI00225E58D7|nr:acyl-CoA thioesterase [Xanthomarina sp. F1114]MCX7547714.1 acyl-CoA thioesterase [Xanthomarina sp. F1114]
MSLILTSKKQKFILKTHEIFLTVSKDDLDELNHVNNVRYVHWVQEVAKDHWLTFASEEIRNANFWVMLTHCIEYKRPAFLDDEIKLKTYITNSEGVTCTRIVEIINNNTNKLLAKSETTWCFMSSKTLKPARITDEVFEIFY